VEDAAHPLVGELVVALPDPDGTPQRGRGVVHRGILADQLDTLVAQDDIDSEALTQPPQVAIPGPEEGAQELLVADRDHLLHEARVKPPECPRPRHPTPRAPRGAPTRRASPGTANRRCRGLRRTPGGDARSPSRRRLASRATRRDRRSGPRY